MITVKKQGIVLKKTSLAFENDSVLNPGVYQDGNTLHMLYRAVKKGNYSTVGYCKFDGPLNVIERYDTPIIIPNTIEENKGVEDPRIVKIDDLFYITYTAYDGINALGALITSKDLINFERKGIITPKFTFDEFQNLAECNNLTSVKYFRHNRHFNPNDKVYIWDKDIAFFPRRINGKLAFLHRIKPGIQLVLIDEIEDLTNDFWTNYLLHFNEHIIIDPNENNHESSYIGGGCPPIETSEGWIMIYHGVYDTVNGYVYTAAVALLDLDNPIKVIARLPYPLFEPELDYELNGVVNNVVFPTGTALFDDQLYIYYGAADKTVACASVSLKELVQELLSNKN
ncbi:pesticidal protein Cry7Aa [Flavobacterium sp.]|uniref:glycoside hydrolase family 130 protein n=1 Tax=Flavobacterium sp. TaxID=239 RepID=UPI003750106F